MFEDINTPEMSVEEFELLGKLIYDHCGLFFQEDKIYFLRKRLSKRLEFHQMTSYRDYHMFLKYDPKADEELAVVVDLLTTNETYFFRENYQLKAFSEEILEEIASKKTDKKLRVWSAGCSTGEEPYTIAILLKKLMLRAKFRDWDVEILGSDISHRVLGVARKGEYSATSFRDMPERYHSYFHDVDNNKKRVSDELKSMVTFMHLNLLDTTRIGLLQEMDVIFCRNVIIYFDQAAKKTVIHNFFDLLKPEGYLLLGHSESLMNLSTAFNLKHLKNDMVYQKPGIEIPEVSVELPGAEKKTEPALSKTVPDTDEQNKESVTWSQIWKEK
ncbi:MAG: protein-glutamate O-methyltransferase CheR [Deltaproteobacteria bacterium]|nr:protein-glutamate O-methyltransferase CheR [Deltaproteobacteria bacterium]